MRPVRVTGVTGTSGWVPLDVFSPASARVDLSGAGAVETTTDDPFATTPTGKALTLTGGSAAVPPGVRAVRGTGMSSADVLVVSQQGAL